MSTENETPVYEELSLEKIVADPLQPRTGELEEGDLAGDPGIDEMVQSVKNHGVLEPILVTGPNKEGKYTIVSGHRRVMASRMAGMSTIRALIVQQKDKETTLLTQLTENIQRQRLGPKDLCAALLRLKHEHGLTVTQIAEKLGRTKSWASKILSVAEDKGLAGKLLEEGKFSNIEAAAKFRSLPEESQVGLYEKSKGSDGVISRTDVETARPVFEQATTKSGSFDSSKFSTPKSEYVPSNDLDTEEGEDMVSNLKLPPPNPADFASGPVIYKDHITGMWILRLPENMIISFLEKRLGKRPKTEDDIVTYSLDAFSERTD